VYLAPRVQDRKILAFGSGIGAAGLVVFAALLGASGHSLDDPISYGSLFACWWAIALGFNIASTVTVSLLSKQLPPEWNKWTSLAIQYSNYTGRVTGAVWGQSSTSPRRFGPYLLIVRRWFGCQGGNAELRRPGARYRGLWCALLRGTMARSQSEEGIEVQGSHNFRVFAGFNSTSNFM
jgi:hypothetical protein